MPLCYRIFGKLCEYFWKAKINSLAIKIFGSKYFRGKNQVSNRTLCPELNGEKRTLDYKIIFEFFSKFGQRSVKTKFKICVRERKLFSSSVAICSEKKPPYKIICTQHPLSKWVAYSNQAEQFRMRASLPSILACVLPLKSKQFFPNWAERKLLFWRLFSNAHVSTGDLQELYLFCFRDGAQPKGKNKYSLSQTHRLRSAEVICSDTYWLYLHKFFQPSRTARAQRKKEVMAH